MSSICYRSLNACLRERFGEKVYKLALDGGFTCPTRDGTLGWRGCNFCAGGSGANGIKFQLLHVLEGTDLAEDYRNGLFRVLSLEEYIQVLERCIEAIPPDMVVHRLTGDGAKRDLIAPLWSADKKHVLNEISRAFDRDHVIQGKAWKAGIPAGGTGFSVK